jgi:hypothetical protein
MIDHFMLTALQRQSIDTALSSYVEYTNPIELLAQ